MVSRNTLTKVNLTQMTASTEMKLDFKDKDESTIIVVQASSPCTLTIKKGDHIQGVCDMAMSVQAGVSLLKIESGRFKNVSGENKGKIVLISSGTPSVGILAMD